MKFTVQLESIFKVVANAPLVLQNGFEESHFRGIILLLNNRIRENEFTVPVQVNELVESKINLYKEDIDFCLEGLDESEYTEFYTEIINYVEAIIQYMKIKINDQGNKATQISDKITYYDLYRTVLAHFLEFRKYLIHKKKQNIFAFREFDDFLIYGSTIYWISKMSTLSKFLIHYNQHFNLNLLQPSQFINYFLHDPNKLKIYQQQKSFAKAVEREFSRTRKDEKIDRNFSKYLEIFYSVFG